jgi:hypothetical protein
MTCTHARTQHTHGTQHTRTNNESHDDEDTLPSQTRRSLKSPRKRTRLLECRGTRQTRKQGRTVSGEYIWKVRDDDAWAEAWPE